MFNINATARAEQEEQAKQQAQQRTADLYESACDWDADACIQSGPTLFLTLELQGGMNRDRSRSPRRQEENRGHAEDRIALELAINESREDNNEDAPQSGQSVMDYALANNNEEPEGNDDSE